MNLLLAKEKVKQKIVGVLPDRRIPLVVQYELLVPESFLALILSSSIVVLGGELWLTELFQAVVLLYLNKPSTLLKKTETQQRIRFVSYEFFASCFIRWA